MTAGPKSKLCFWSAFIVITLVAAFFRFYHLDDHPLGLFFDPAINGLDALRLMQRGGPVLFFPTNGGREALLIYLLIPFVWLFGATPFSFRLQLALISLLNVVCLFGLLYDLRFTIYDLRFVRLRQALTNCHSQFTIHHSLFTILFPSLATLILAVSYWHITISRLDQRPLIVPLLAVLVFWFFLKGWTAGGRRWFILSGLFLGLSFHTYSAARLLPVILILAVIPEFFIKYQVSGVTHHASSVKCQVSRLMLFSVMTLLVAGPMLWYFAGHPAQFSARAGSVMIWNFLDTPTDILAELGRNLWRVLGFFCCVGNPNAIFGLPGEPGLPLILTPFLVVGLVVAVLNWRNLFARLVAVWWLVGIFPSIIAIEAPHPLRMIVALPPTAILVALGLVCIMCQVSGVRYHVSSVMCQVSRFTFYVLPFIIIFATVPRTFSAYFLQWPRLEVTQGIFDYGAVAIRDAILEHAEEATPIYLPLSRYNDAPLLYYLSGRYQRQAALSAPPAERALVISPEKNETEAVWVRLQDYTAIILPPLSPAGQQFIQAALAGDAATPIRTLSGETAATLAPLPGDPAQFAQPPGRSLNAIFDPVQLSGATYPFEIKSETGGFPVTLYWQAINQMADEYEVVLQLVDDSRRVWGDGTARPNDWVYPTSFWRPGLDIIAAQQHIAVTGDPPPPGRYWLAVALYDPAAGQRLPLIGTPGDSPNTFFIGPLKVPLPPPANLPTPTTETTFGGRIELLNFHIADSTPATGESVQVELLWQTIQAPPLDYTVFVHLMDSRGNVVAGHDAQPVNNSYPTTIWTPGERIFDRHAVPIPADLPPGPYRLSLGFYHQSTGERLPIQSGEGQPDSKGEFVLDTPVIVVER
ncbi:MAG: hypothetical protein U0401_04045 [Anaerolineae bacterium]